MNELEKAIQARDEFLKRNPHMQKFQDELNEFLSRAPQEKRLEVVGLMMTGKLLDLQSHLSELCTHLKKFV